MELRLRDSQRILDVDFGNWLLLRIKTRLISNIRKYNMYAWDKFLTTSNSFTRKYNREYKAEEIIISAANSLICEGTLGEISIHIDYNKFAPGFDNLKLNAICKAINYGTLEVRGRPIFSDTLEEFSNEIDTYARLYYRY